MSNGSHEVPVFSVEHVPTEKPKRKKMRWRVFAALSSAMVASTGITFFLYLGLMLGGASAKALTFALFGSSFLLFSTAGLGLFFTAVFLVALLVAASALLIVQHRDAVELMSKSDSYANAIAARGRDLEGHIRALAQTLQIRAAPDVSHIIQSIMGKIESDKTSLKEMITALESVSLISSESKENISSWATLLDNLKQKIDDVRPQELLLRDAPSADPMASTVRMSTLNFDNPGLGLFQGSTGLPASAPISALEISQFGNNII